MLKAASDSNVPVIGVCGMSGSGKSYFSELLASFGGTHIDADAVYHRLLVPTDGCPSPLTRSIAHRFGDGLILGDGALDRRALSKIVFSDEAKLTELNRLTHGAVTDEILSLIKETDRPFAVADVPLLFESGFDSYCDITVCVLCDLETGIARITERDGISEDAARLRMQNQRDVSSLADITVINDGVGSLESDCLAILRKLGIDPNGR